MNYEDRVLSYLRQPHISALEMLQQAGGFGFIPSDICSGHHLAWLKRSGLVEKGEFTGTWELTEEGWSADLTLKEPAPPHPWRGRRIPDCPDAETQALLMRTYEMIDALKPGDFIFDGEVRRGALDTLSNRTRKMKFLYFAYPIGFPMKHIAWAVRNSGDGDWTDTEANVNRYNIGLPALRTIRRAREKPTVVDPLYERLRAEGISDDEIREFYAVREDGKTVL